MRVLYGPQRLLASWIETRLGIELGACSVIGIERKDILVAVCAYNNFRWPDIQMHIATASPEWCSREAISVFLRYPFTQLGCKRVTAVTDAANQPAREFLRRIGFEEEGYHPQATTHGDAVSYGMLADKCRWLERRNEISTVSPSLT